MRVFMPELMFDPGKDAVLKCSGKSMTIKSQKEEADINVIVKRFGVTGMLPQRPITAPLSTNFVDILDFQGAMNATRAAKESFMALPADVRYRFHNNPGEFISFCDDPANLPELRKLGVFLPAKVDVVPVPLKVEVVNPVDKAVG